MKIELTPTEIRRLIDLVYIATWIIDAHKIGDDPETAPYRRLEQKLFAIAAQQGLSDVIEYADEFDLYFPTRALEESQAHSFIDEYDDDTFWEELMARLAERDLINDLGSFQALVDLSPEKRVTLLGRREEYYANEFAEHGLDRLAIAPAANEQ